MRRGIEDEIREVEEQIYAIAGVKFDINSPVELSQILFEKMGLPPTYKTEQGYSTDIHALAKLWHVHPVIRLLVDHYNLKMEMEIPLGTDLIEVDDYGIIVGWGNHSTYDTYALQVMNGEGYYDEDGHYHSYHLYD